MADHLLGQIVLNCQRRLLCSWMMQRRSSEGLVHEGNHWSFCLILKTMVLEGKGFFVRRWPRVIGGAPDVLCARHGDLAVSPDQATTASAPGPPCSRVCSLICVTLELNTFSNLFYQTLHARSTTPLMAVGLMCPPDVWAHVEVGIQVDDEVGAAEVCAICCTKKSSLFEWDACHLHYCGDCLSIDARGVELVAHAE